MPTGCKSSHNGFLEVIESGPLESMGTVSSPHSIATMAVSLTVSTQYTNVTDTTRRYIRHSWRDKYYEAAEAETARKSATQGTAQAHPELKHCCQYLK